MRRPYVALIGTALMLSSLAACSTTPPEEDPVQIRLHDLDARLARIERVMANQSLLELSNQIEALRGDVRGMHNDVDQLNNATDANRKQQRDLYADLDRRMKALEARGAAAGSAAPSGASAPVVGGGAPSSSASAPTAQASPAAPAGYDGPSSDDKSGYQSAFTFLKEGQYDRAVPAFQKFLATYPDSALAENAQYWLGEANYVNKAFPEAEAAFQKVVDKYPQSRKVPDALLKIGYCRYEMKQYESAKLALSQVITQFPDNGDAKLAQQRIEKMAAEKH
jgi:tol-pal system protein YbgF